MNKNRIRGGGRRASGQVTAKPISIKYVRRKLRWQCAESDRTYLGRSASCPLRVFRPKLDCARRKAHERGAEVSRGHSKPFAVELVAKRVAVAVKARTE